MQWSDKGMILGMRRHGEASVILEAMTETHGRHFGLVRGGRSSRMRALLQTGNSVGLTWRARLEDHLGNYAVEADRSRAAALFDSPLALSALQTLAAHLRLLPERDPHPGLFAAAEVILEHLGDGAVAARLMARFELELLDELGFGLDLSRCALTGSRHDLAWVSPLTGKAATREAGARWAPKLLALPRFLVAGENATADAADIGDAFALTRHFLSTHVWLARAIAEPAEREKFVRLALRSAAGGEPGG